MRHMVTVFPMSLDFITKLRNFVTALQTDNKKLTDGIVSPKILL